MRESRPRAGRRLASAAFALGLAASPLSADAADFDWSVGPRIGLSFNSFNVEPDASALAMAGASSAGSGTETSQVPVPDLSGLGGGVGFSGDLVFGKFVGVEAGATIVRAQATGDKTLTLGRQSAAVDYTLTTLELHVPVLAKAQTSVGQVVVQGGVGVTAVVQLDSELEANPSLADVETDNETDFMPTLLLGVRIPVGPVSVPVELRLMSAYEPESLSERFDVAASTLRVDTSWTGQAWLTTGIVWGGTL